MSLQQKVAVVLGATGVVGGGVVRKYLDAGATVVGVSRSAKNLEGLKAQHGIGASEPFLSVVGDLVDEASAAAVKRAVDAALGGRAIDHVVSVQGFVQVAKPPTETPLEEVKRAIDGGLVNNYLAAKVFLPGMKARQGASFTLVSGGLAHFPPPNPAVWLGTLKNAALNGLQHALASETMKDAVRVNTICIHFSVAPVGGDKNQLGMPAESSTMRLAPAFLAVARGAQKGQLLCLSSFAAADELASQ